MTDEGQAGVAEERALVDALRAGEEGAYASLLESHGPRMLATARRLLGNEEEARDAFQEAFLSAFKSVGSFREGSLLSTWLHRIVVNAALMRLRRRGRKPEQSIEELLPRFDESGHHAGGVQPWSDPFAAAQRSELRTLVRGAIDELPESHREVLLLRDVEQLSTQEAAQVLGITPNATKVRLHRARQALRELLAPRFEEEPP